MVLDGVHREEIPGDIVTSEFDFNDSSVAVQPTDEDIAQVDHVVSTVSIALTFDRSYEEFAAELKAVVPFDSLAIRVIDPDSRIQVIEYLFGPAVSGLQAGGRKSQSWTDTKSYLIQEETLVYEDVAAASTRHPHRENLALGFRSSIVIPLVAQQRQIGIIDLGSRRAGAFQQRELALLELVAAKIAPAVGNIGRFEQARVEKEWALAALERSDIQRKRLEKRLSAEAEELGMLTHALAVCSSAIMIADQNAIIRYVNPRFTFLTGFASNEIVGQVVDVVEPEEEPDSGYQHLRSSISSATERRGEYLRRKKSGAEFWTSRSLSSVLNPQGLERLFVVVDEDISERKMLESRLLQAQRMGTMGQLASGIAHYFNNLLLAMQGFTALLKARLEPSIETYEYSVMIETLAQKGSDLTSRLLTTARASSTKIKPMDLNAAIREVVQMITPSLSGNIHTVCQLPADLPLIHGDFAQMQQVIMNLCLNAGDAMPEGGRLELCTKAFEMTSEGVVGQNFLQPGRYVQLSVSDTGIGITEENKAIIFEPFFTTKGTGEGTGLGLSVVYGILREHGGAIEVASSPGQGSVFDVFLPVSDTNTT